MATRINLVLLCLIAVPAQAWEGKSTDWNGFRRFDFQVDRRPCFVVVPNKIADGQPWVWRARFPSYHAEADALLLERGFHIAHIDTAGMLGSPRAMKHWDAFYDVMTDEHGLAKRPALEAVSRGGLFAYRWAARHPDRVACIYADTPVCDFKSWPLGQGTGIGSLGTWSTLLSEYGFTQEQALAFRENPIDVLKPIAEAKIPLLHIISLNDRVVPPAENTFVLAKRYRELGGTIDIIEVNEGTEKSSGHHFTHPDPGRVADFITTHALSKASVTEKFSEKPNIVLIFADDMGIDSVGALNDKLGISTPNLDLLVSQGMSFTDAHTTSAVCTPSRYGLLTGRYNWRSRLKRGIVHAWERPLIKDERLTLPEMLREKGYATQMIGKWHLGFHWPKQGGGTTEKLKEIDFTGSIKGGPVDHGFDDWFGDDVPNWPPYAWRHNDQLLGEITTTAKNLNLKSVTDGPAVADWSLEAVLPEYAKRCSEYIRQRANAQQPFFLYFPMPSPHTPIAPDKNWKGKSGISDYADFVMETDWAVGEVLHALDESGQAEDTLVIFTTDNGTSPRANFDELESHGVFLKENWRGYKADAFEGGHRVPCVVRWPNKIVPGSRSDEIISLVDVMATIADVTNYDLPETAAEDSFSLLPILLGEPLDRPLHDAIVCHSISGQFAVRQGRWKVLFCPGSGGWSDPRDNIAKQQGLPPIQLYDVQSDPKETTNLWQRYPKIVDKLNAILRDYVEKGRSTPRRTAA